MKNEINIQERKQYVNDMLLEIQADAETLLSRIRHAQDAIANVTDMESAMAFDEEFGNLEEGLKHIELV